MIGTPEPLAARAQSSMAVICGTPTPATMRVVQMEPGPMPTFTASTPASMSARVAWAVATLPATSSNGPFQLRRVSRTASSTPRLWPWAVSMTSTSTPALSRASTRASRSAPTPTAAAASRRCCASMAAWG